MRKLCPVVLILCLIMITACGRSDPPTPTATPTPIPPTATPTPIPLSLEERAYLDAIHKLNDKYDRDAISWDLMEEHLKGLKAPVEFAEAHNRLLATLQEVSFASEMFRLSATTYMLSYCSFSSLDYYSCMLRQDNALSDMKRYGAEVDAARALFRTQWTEAQATWADYRLAHGEQPIPSATPFQLPPAITPAPRKTAATGVFGAEVTVTAVNMDAWSTIQAFNSYNKAPAAGNKYVMVTVRVVNRSSEKIWVSAGEFSIYADRTNYKESAQTNPDDFESKDLEPGASTSGNLSFEAPKGLSGAVLLYLMGDLSMALE